MPKDNITIEGVKALGFEFHYIAEGALIVLLCQVLGPQELIAGCAILDIVLYILSELLGTLDLIDIIPFERPFLGVEFYEVNNALSAAAGYFRLTEPPALARADQGAGDAADPRRR